MKTKRKAMERLRRRATVDAELRSMTISWGGRNTEPYYLKAPRRAYSSAPLAMEIVEGVGVPFTITSKAVAKVKDDHIERYALRNERQTLTTKFGQCLTGTSIHGIERQLAFVKSMVFMSHGRILASSCG